MSDQPAPAEFTPGPWERRGFDVYQEGALHLVAAAWGDCAPTQAEVDASRLANAQLIAAAPDLLAACEAVDREKDGWGHISADTWHMVEVALARAKGES